jgi:hypothetical protein
MLKNLGKWVKNPLSCNSLSGEKEYNTDLYPRRAGVRLS